MSLKREIGYLCRGEHRDPYRLLGPHFINGKTFIRAFLPEAKEAWVIKEMGPMPMQDAIRNGMMPEAIAKTVNGIEREIIRNIKRLESESRVLQGLPSMPGVSKSASILKPITYAAERLVDRVIEIAGKPGFLWSAEDKVIASTLKNENLLNEITKLTNTSNPAAKQEAIDRVKSALKLFFSGGEEIHPMQKIFKVGFFEISLNGITESFRYRIRINTHWDEVMEFYDPYSFDPELLTDFDLRLLGEGNHYKIYKKLGAHIIEVDGIKGTYFALWAPNALRVGIVGNFNHWDGRRHPMKFLGDSGIWGIFIPGIDEGELYKFEIKSRCGTYLQQKADPFASFFELRPKSASIVYGIDGKYSWHDAEWMEMRRNKNWFESPVAIYEVHLGSWMASKERGGFLTYREIGDRLVPYVKEMGYTHIELLPITEHPLDASWGYQPIGYYAPTSRFGRPEDFMCFIDKCHQNGIGVIMDWVPAHFPRDAHGLAFFDGTWLYEHADPRKGEHKDWGTLVFNYGRNEVKNFLIANALFWLEKYHIDGLRVDAVASMLYLDYSRRPGEWIPNIYGGNENLEAIDFLKKFNEIVHKLHPGILTIAEESTAWPAVSRPTYIGGLGFSMKWNMGWMHDTLKYFSKNPTKRKYHTNELTFSLLYAFSENFILPFSHDEVVYGKRSMLHKMPGDEWQKFANLRALYGYMYGHPGKKLLFMGSEFGQWNEWCFFRGLDWNLLDYEPHRKLQKYFSDLNRLYRAEPALYEVDFDPRGFEWINFHDHNKSVISFIRRAKNPRDFLVFVFNLTPEPIFNYRIGVPRGGFYREILNSDSELYWGGNLGNAGGVYADKMPSHGRQYSLNLTLPPLSVLIFKPL